MSIKAVIPVDIPYKDLVAFSTNSLPQSNLTTLLAKIEVAYGKDGLGLLTISSVPNFASLRQNLLPLAQRFAFLPDFVKEKCVDAESRFQLGWSHGIETLENNQPDKMKGSYYANPVINDPELEEEKEGDGENGNLKEMRRKFANYTRRNVWPTEELPELESAFMELGKVVYEVGKLLAAVLDFYLDLNKTTYFKTGTENNSKNTTTLLEMMKRSKSHKARLLHYFSAASDDRSEMNESANKWCGTHVDHGALTGLCAAMYLDKDFKDVSYAFQTFKPSNEQNATVNAINVVNGISSEAAGLYVLNRPGEAVKIEFSPDKLAFQIGRVVELMSGGKLPATPHFVSASQSKYSRNTFAVFLQPNWDEKLISNSKEVLFGDFTHYILDLHHKL